MAQEQKETAATADLTTSERYPLVDPDADVDTEEDITDEVRAARAQVENTRAGLTDTIDALKEKLSPTTLVAEAKEATIGAAQAAVGDAVDSAKEVAHNVVDTAKEFASNAASVVKEVASNVASSLGGATDTAKSAVSEAAHSASEMASDTLHHVKEVSHSAGNSVRGAGATIVETIRLNPLPAAITGIGLGWLIMSIRRQNEANSIYGNNGISPSAGRFVSMTDEFGQSNSAIGGYNSSGSNGSSRVDAAKEKLGEVKDSVTHQASDIAHTVSDKASDLASTVGTKASDIAHTVGDKASALGGQAKETAQSAVNATGTYISDNPLAAGAIALLIGVGIGLLVPGTEKENQLLGETRDRLKDQAAEQLHQVADKVTSVAQTAFDSAKDTVKEGVETVKETVKTEARNQGLTGTSA